jgi:hypothetical protein
MFALIRRVLANCKKERESSDLKPADLISDGAELSFGYLKRSEAGFGQCMMGKEK